MSVVNTSINNICTGTVTSRLVVDVFIDATLPIGNAAQVPRRLGLLNDAKSVYVTILFDIFNLGKSQHLAY